jgi:hypothetical protein
MYFWGNVLNLEASKVLEQTRNNSEANNFTENNTIELLNLSRELQRQSLYFYEQALDIKFAEFYNVAMGIYQSDKQDDMYETMVLACSYYIKAVNTTETPRNPELIEQILTLKRNAVEKLEETIKMYNTEPEEEKEKEEYVEQKIDDKMQEEYIEHEKEIQNIENNPDENAISVVKIEHKKPLGGAEASYRDQILEYKIQIGAFKKNPDQKLLDKIKPITKSEPDESGLTKYYSGSYEKYEDAKLMVSTIREAGFPGAFVVAFLDGIKIPLDKAKEIE